MNASQLIAKLQELIKLHGDMPVALDDDGGVYNVENVTYPQFDDYCCEREQMGNFFMIERQ